jgi:hypothetical protein
MQNDNNFIPNSSLNNILIGDSIVAGGNLYRKSQRLGVKLSEKLNKPVWSVSAGSWSILNEIAYLRLHPNVVNGATKLIFISNSGDFNQASSWSCEYTHPRQYPNFAAIYLFKKYIYDYSKSCNEVPKDLLVPNADWRRELSSEFLKSKYLKAFLGERATELAL